MKGYELNVVIPGGEDQVLCVGHDGRVRGMYEDGMRCYFSSWELWHGAAGCGAVDGALASGATITVRHCDGGILLAYDGTPLRNVVVRSVLEVNIEEMARKRSIVGIHEPPWRPGSLN